MSLPTPEPAPPDDLSGGEALRSKPSSARVLSWVFGFGFLALVGAFVWQAGMFASLLPRTEPARDEAAPKPSQVTVGASRYTGTDRDRQPYWVEADSAIQDDKNTERVHLDKVRAEMRRLSGEVVSLRAANAVYDSKAKVLDLAGDVRIVSQGNYAAQMSRATVTVEDKVMTTDVPVNVEFASGTIAANGMKITEDGARILFFNRVKARFDPTSGGSAAQ